MYRLIVAASCVALLAVPLIGSSASAAKPKCGGLEATIVGTMGADVIRGTTRRDVIVTKGGNDVIYGRGGKDIICSGGGKDVVYGGPAKDHIWGGSKRDRIYGGDGNDWLHGEKGWDRLDGGPGNDHCYKDGGGAQLISCARPDVKVSFPSGLPSMALDGEYFTWGVRLDNTGPDTVTVTLEAKNSFRDVTCGTNIQKKVEILVGGRGTIFWNEDQRCQIDGSQPSVRLLVSLTGSFPDVNPDNNDASHTITIIGGP